MATRTEELIKELIPFIETEFISFTCDRWEEGDYRPILHTWIIVHGDTQSKMVENTKTFLSFMEDFMEQNYPEYECYTEKTTMNLADKRTHYSLSISQKGYILDEDIKPSFDLDKLLEIAVNLHKEYKNITKWVA